jgi:hypothetical protein
MVIERQAGPYQPKDSEGYIDWDMWLGHEWGLAPKVPWDPKRYFKFRGYWDYNGGVATDLLYHFLAPILKAVIGDDGGYPWRVTGNGGLYIHDDGREVPDTFLMTVDYPENFSVFMESTVTNEYFRPLRLYGQYGTITTSDRRPNLLLENAPAFREKFMELNDGYEEVVVAPEEQRRDMEGNLIDAIREDVPLHCNVDLGAATMVAIKMGVESYRQSKTLLWDGDDEKVYSL